MNKISKYTDCLPKGFLAFGLNSGIKKGKKDIAIFYSEKPAFAFGLFTKNIVKAAPIIVSMDHLNENHKSIRAILANSGNANACTGARGIDDARSMCNELAKYLSINTNQILIASTGVIGKFLPMDNVKQGIKRLSSYILSGKNDYLSAVESIMTTDTFPKIFCKKFSIGGREVTLSGCAKGAGMIHPNLSPFHATMLCFIFTDALISYSLLQKAIKKSAQSSFNCISVDGDTSTNDTVFILSNGIANEKKIVGYNEDFHKFQRALDEVCNELSKMIVRDGEGATHMIEIEVKNAKSNLEAHKIASTIATSPLVKTAFFGQDANWGRIIACCGRSGVNLDPSKIDIYLCGVLVAKNGMAVNFSEDKLKDLLAQKDVSVVLDLHRGSSGIKFYTCDLSLDYVRINANYRT